MKHYLSFSAALLLTYLCFGQTNVLGSKLLTPQENDSIFTDSLKTELQIDFPIYRIYNYYDKSGEYFILMTEQTFNPSDKEVGSNAIQAFCYKYIDENYEQQWRLKDFILPEGNEVSEEYEISFWTKYFQLEDYDSDGIIDPIIIYGTKGMNAYSDGRIKILVYHHNKKRAIRHQNGTLDFERNTKVDEQFYKLPQLIQSRVSEIMRQITENDHGIFPYGWQEAMKNKELHFDEY